MRLQILLFFMITIGALASAADLSYDFTLAKGGFETRLPPLAIAMHWTDPATPSCQVFAFRKRLVLQQAEEIDFLLARLNRDHGSWSKNQRAELEQWLSRQASAKRELKAQKLEVEATFTWPESPAQWGWVVARKYRLLVQAPSLTWKGFDAAEPEGVALTSDGNGLRVKHMVALSDVCGKPLALSVRLEAL